MMRFRILKYLVLAVLMLVNGIVLCWADGEKDNSNLKDSVLVHLVDAKEGTGLDGNLQVTLWWKVFVKKYDPQTGEYGDWFQIDDFKGRFEVLTALDSSFSKVVKRIETDSTVCTIAGLSFGTHYWWRVNLISPNLPSRSDFAEGVIYRH